jgi:iron complex outermembrane receptor protein
MRSFCSHATNEPPRLNRFVRRVAAAALLISLIARGEPQAELSFHIQRRGLVDALEQFSEQSGLQIVYDPSIVSGKQARGVHGSMTTAAALERLLAGSGIRWSYLEPDTIVVEPVPSGVRLESRASLPSADASAQGVATLSPITVYVDSQRVLPNEASESAFGFSKPLLETPRSVSFISQETIDRLGLSAVEDLVRVVPGVFTTTRFGIQGAVDVRGVPADTYIRGMKRLSLQGHGRSVLAAMDAIEIVGGPPSPIYGMGKIGGYTNMVPKSGRAHTGSYLESVQGFAQLSVGTYDRHEASFGIGGPLSALKRFDRSGGYYVYGLLEDSESFTHGVPVRQQLLQAAVSIDDFIGPFRLETGVNYQVSRTAGALTGRFTQDLVDRGRYIRGTPLIDLDANGNGAIGYLEMQQGSPVSGSLTTGNQPLLQTWTWPTDSNGHPLPIEQFPVVPGIPRAMYEYLLAHPEADPTGRLRSQGVGGPLPESGEVPIGMVLDPRTVGFDTLDLRRAAAFEKELRAEFQTVFLDLIHDANPDFTIKNQLFFDRMDQYKNSHQPFVQEQEVYVIEDKLTLTRRLQQLPPWLRVNALASLNWRTTVSRGRTAGADFSSHRTDAMADTWRNGTGGMTANTTFASPIDNANLLDDGYPWGTLYRTQFSEIGLGVLFDVDVASRVNLMLGARIDGSDARNTDRAGSFNPAVGTSDAPGAYLERNVTARSWEEACSWSASVSYAHWGNVRPYATWARSSVVLDGNNNALTNNVIEAGHIGQAELKEIGLKASLFDERLFLSLAAYEQARLDVDADDDPALIYAYATATRTRGDVLELKWVPSRHASLAFYAMSQITRFDPNVGSVQLVDARTLGFQDVVDENGNVIYPAEAFLYGGRSRIVLPPGMSRYAKKQGNPPTQVGLTTSYRWTNDFGVILSSNYFSSTCTGRLCTVRLPEIFVVNAGAFYDIGAWTLKLDANNLFNERYFRARTGDTLGNVLAQAMPDRRVQVTVKYEFR